MAYRVIRENNRSEGLPVLAGETIIAGAPVMLDTTAGLAVKKADAVAMPYGVACESTEPLPMAAPTGLTAGVGYDYTNYNRGQRLLSAFVTGSELELFDDGHGLPFDAAYGATVAYTVNTPVYADAAGLVSTDPTSTLVIGHVVDADVPAAPTRLRVKFVL
jgi:hypothetical protein